jgi:hypothetical protein
MRAITILAFVGVIGLASNAGAAVVQCPGTAAGGDREFTIDVNPAVVTATCYDSGPGNINGNPGPNDPFLLANPTLVVLDKTDDGNTYGGTANEITVTGIPNGSGTFSITFPSGFSTFYLGLKSGEGQLDPDWVIFKLVLAPGTTSITGIPWTVSSQGLSHMILYGDPAPVPLPGALPLLMAALGALLGFFGWRRRAAA